MTAVETRTKDRYPTRSSADSRLIECQEPAVWSDVDTGPADAEDLAAHQSRGFHQVELLSPAKVQQCWLELQRLTSDPRTRSDERTVVEKGSDEVRSIFEVHRSSPAIARLIREPRILDRARQLLGSDVYVHQSRINYMPGFQAIFHELFIEDEDDHPRRSP